MKLTDGRYKTNIEKLVNVEPLTKEKKAIRKALNVLAQVGEPIYISSDARFKTKLRPQDEARLWYARGILESLLFEDDLKQ